MSSFKETNLSVFNEYAPIKKKYIRANEASFMTKNLHQEVMKRSKLRKKCLKPKCLTDIKNCNLQHNFCKKLLRITKKEYLITYTLKNVTDTELFGKLLILPLFSNKNSKKSKS